MLIPARTHAIAASVFLSAIFFFAVLGCRATSKRVVILVDGERREVDTQEATVDLVLRSEKIQLGENDRVDPPGYTPIDRTATIHIVRVELTTETQRVPIQFGRRLIRDDALPEGKIQSLQLGSNGEEEVTFQVTLEDDKQVSRREIGRKVVKQPLDEILEIGTQNTLTPVPLNGTLVYLAHGKAWVLKDSSDNKRPLTSEGDLDGRVFDLSPEGRYLIFTRAGTGTANNSISLNTLWMVDTVILGEKPRHIPIDNLLYAQWAPDGSNRIAYSTGEKTPGAPGWKAHNDLFIATLETTTMAPIAAVLPATPSSVTGGEGVVRLGTRQIISSSVPAPFAWWGANLTWSPDGQVVAYGFPDQVGFVNLLTGTRRAVKKFAYYNSRSDWIWTPQIAWSPDSRFVVATVHAPPDGAGPLEDSSAFDLWAFARDSSVNLALVSQSGMWAAPTWSPPDVNHESRIAYGVALNSADSERSRYALYIMDRDGSNRTRIFPQGNENGLQVVQVAWSPDDSQLVAVRDGDLWLYDFSRASWSQLTSNGDSRLPKWK